jgi:Kef-type K+ transport system membrane component KefB
MLMPIPQLFILFGCLVFSAFVRRILAPLIAVPSVFLHLVGGFGLGLLLKSEFGKDNLAVLHDDAMLQTLGLIGWLGILLLMALGPCHAEAKSRAHAHALARVAVISVIGFGGTFVAASTIGYGLALFAPNLMGAVAIPLAFGLAIGLACAVTALPVLVSLLHEREDHESVIGKLAIRIAILDDLWLWLVLLVVLGMVNSQTSPLLHMFKLGGFVAYALFLLKPALACLYKNMAGLSSANHIVVGLSLIVLIATASEAIGTHALFGAFMAGWVLPAYAIKTLQQNLLPVGQAMLVPFFFIMTGLKTDLSLGNTNFILLAIFFTLIGLGLKICFVSLAARSSGMNWARSFELGALLQCKGLMEIVTLGLMRDAKIIGPEVFSALIVMAIACTVVTVPLRSLIVRFCRPSARQQAAAAVSSHHL